jgi:hypothetical protein
MRGFLMLSFDTGRYTGLPRLVVSALHIRWSELKLSESHRHWPRPPRPLKGHQVAHRRWSDQRHYLNCHCSH